MGALLLGFLGALAINVPTSGAETIDSAILTTEQLDGLGLNLRPLPVAALAAPVSEPSARSKASDRATVGNDPEVLHVLAEITPGVDKSVWLYIANGGDAELPLGPYGAQTKRTPEFTGVLVDDQTGKVVLVFYGGKQ